MIGLGLHRYMPDMSETVETLPILLVPDPILKARARPVGADDMQRVRELVPRMFATMYRAPGIGLAAPQVGVGLRFAVVDLMPDDKPAPIVLINPEVHGAQRGAGDARGRLPVAARPVCRRDPAGAGDGALHRRRRRRRQIEAEGLLAACLQHEIDHLDGVLFVDHLSALKRNMILRRLAKELRQKRAEAM